MILLIFDNKNKIKIAYLIKIQCNYNFTVIKIYNFLIFGITRKYLSIFM